MFAFTGVANSGSVKPCLSIRWQVRTKNTREILPFSNLLQDGLIAHLQSPFLTIEHMSRSVIHDVHNPDEILPFFPWNVFGCKFSKGCISDLDRPRQELSRDHHLRGRNRRSIENALVNTQGDVDAAHRRFFVALAYTFLALMSILSNEYPSPPWPMISRAARVIQSIMSISALPFSFSICTVRTARSYRKRGIQQHKDEASFDHRDVSAYLVGYPIEYGSHVAHVAARKHGGQEFPLSLMVFPCERYIDIIFVRDILRRNTHPEPTPDPGQRRAYSS